MPSGRTDGRLWGQTAKNSLYFPPDGPSAEVERCIHLTGYQSELWIRIGWKTASLLSLSLSLFNFLFTIIHWRIKFA
jgi:hypothetical protein